MTPSWEANDGSLKEHMVLFSSSYGTLLSFTVSRRACHWILTWAIWTQCTSSKSCLHKLQFNIIHPSSHISSRGLFLFYFKPKCRKNFSSPMSSLSFVIDFTILTIFSVGQQLWSSTLCNSYSTFLMLLISRTLGLNIEMYLKSNRDNGSNTFNIYGTPI